MADHAIYTRGSIGGRMLKNAGAMIAGTLAMSGYNLTDAYFIGKIPGAEPLAAIGFTFPVILLFTFLMRGVIVGVTTLAAYAIGAKNEPRAKRIVTWGTALTVLLSCVFGVIGIATIDPVFRGFGAGGETLKLINDYMFLWYLGCATLSLVMIGNDLLLAIGKPRAAALIMLGGMLFNALLDPLMIFGWGFVPAMGLTGAALATVAAQIAAMSAVLWLLLARYRLLTFVRLSWRRICLLWGVILRIGVPATLGMLMLPLASAIVTKLVASFGDAAIAATTAAMRIEQAAFVLPMAFGMTMTPFIGQNFGAKLYSRIRQCRRFAMRSSLIFLTVIAALFTLFSHELAGIFTTHDEVRRITAQYLIIVSWGFGFIEVHRYSTFVYIGCGKPALAAWISALRIIGLMIPLSAIAWHFDSLIGIFWARLAADLISGSIGWFLTSRLTRRFPADGTAWTA